MTPIVNKERAGHRFNIIFPRDLWLWFQRYAARKNEESDVHISLNQWVVKALRQFKASEEVKKS